ncbi:MAG: T9SS type A sorting domain-containing protein [Ferruginibacter sp.]
MKKIILLFFTFSGICCCLAQPVKTIDTVNGKKDAVSTTPKFKKDSLSAKENPSVRLYPNPAKNKAEIEIKGFEAGYVKIQLINNAGKLLLEEKRLVVSGNEVIIFMFSEKPGLYFLLLKQGKIMVKSKLVIQ